MYYSKLTTGTKTAIFLSGLLYLLVYIYSLGINQRLRKVENALSILEDPSETEARVKPVSYKMDLSIEPDWFNIIGKLFPDLKNSKQAPVFINNLLEDKALKIDKDESLWLQWFSFTIFYDGISALTQVWSQYHKTFIDEVEVRGYILKSRGLDEKFPDNNINHPVVITPNYIGFHTVLPDGEVMDEDKISQIPFWKILEFFIEVQKNSGTIWEAKLAVKKFPKNIQKLLEKHNVKYDPWDYEDYGTGVDFKKDIVKSKWLESQGIELYDQKVRSHTFRTSCYSIHFSINFFEP